MTIYWTDADVSNLSQMSHYPHGWACYGSYLVFQTRTIISKPFFFEKSCEKIWRR